MRNPRPRDHHPLPPTRPAGYVTVRRAMEILQCSEPTIRRLIYRRRVGVINWRYRVLIREKDLHQWSRVRRYRPRQLAVHARRLTPFPQSATGEVTPA